MSLRSMAGRAARLDAAQASLEDKGAPRRTRHWRSANRLNTELKGLEVSEDLQVNGSAPPDDSTDKLRDRLIGYIPAETFGPTVALYAYFSDQFWPRAFVTIGLALATPIWVWINYVDQQTDRRLIRKIPWRAMALGLLAYAVWIGAIPGSVYLVWPHWNLRLGTGVVAAGAVVIVLINGSADAYSKWRAAA